MGMKPIGERCFFDLVGTKRNNIEIKAIVSNVHKETVWWESNSLYLYSKEKGIPFCSCEKRDDETVESLIRDNNINCIISNGYNWILPRKILKLVDYCAFNLHLAILPTYQGNFTYNHAILNGEKEYGITLHWMTENVDNGDYIFMPRFRIDEDDTTEILYEKSVTLGTEFFNKFIELIENGGEVPRHPMVGEAHFYDRRSIDSLRQIRDINDTEEIDRKSRAFSFPPFENAYVVLDNKKYYLLPGERINEDI